VSFHRVSASLRTLSTPPTNPWSGSLAMALGTLAFVSVAILGACTRNHPKLDELVAACGLRTDESRDARVYVLLSSDGSRLPQSALEMQVVSSAGEKRTPKLQGGCVSFPVGARAVALVRSAGGDTGAVIAPDEKMEAGVEALLLKPVSSREDFESCGVLTKQGDRLLPLLSSNGSRLIATDVVTQRLANKEGRNDSAREGITPLGCLQGNKDERWLVQSFDGRSATYVGGDVWTSERVLLDDKIPAATFKSCQSPLTGKARADLIASKTRLMLPVAEGGAQDVGAWSVCRNVSGCDTPAWNTDDVTSIGRCLAVPKTSSAVLLRAERPTGLVGRADVTSNGLVADEIKMRPFLSVAAFAAGSNVRIPQCIAGKALLAPGGKVSIEMRGPNEGAVLDGRIRLAMGSGTSVVDVSGTRLSFQLSRATQRFEPRIEAIDLFGRSVFMPISEPCVFDVRPAVFPETKSALDAISYTHDVNSVLKTGLPSTLADGMRLHVAYRLSPAAPGASAGSDARPARDGTAVATAEQTLSACLKADGFREASDGLIPLTTAGRFDLEMRMCAENGEMRTVSTRALHVDGRKPTFYVDAITSPHITNFESPLAVTVRELSDDILSFDDLLSGLRCNMRLRFEREDILVPSTCKVERKSSLTRTAVLSVSWSLGPNYFSDELLTLLLDKGKGRVEIEIPTSDERMSFVKQWIDIPFSEHMSGGWDELNSGMMPARSSGKILAVGNSINGKPMILTSRMQLLKTDSDDKPWVNIANARAAYPGKLETVTDFSVHIMTHSRRIGINDMLGEFDNHQGLGIIVEFDTDRFAILDQSNSLEDDPDSEVRTISDVQPFFRAICEAEQCRSRKELTSSDDVTDVQSGYGRIFVTGKNTVWTLDIDGRNRRKYSRPADFPRYFRRAEFLITARDEIWLGVESGLAIEKIKIISLSDGNSTRLSELLPIDTDLDLKKSANYAVIPRLDSSSDIMMSQGDTACIISYRLANCGKIQARPTESDYARFIGKSIVIGRSQFIDPATFEMRKFEKPEGYCWKSSGSSVDGRIYTVIATTGTCSEPVDATPRYYNWDILAGTMTATGIPVYPFVLREMNRLPELHFFDLISIRFFGKMTIWHKNFFPVIERNSAFTTHDDNSPSPIAPSNFSSWTSNAPFSFLFDLSRTDFLSCVPRTDLLDTLFDACLALFENETAWTNQALEHMFRAYDNRTWFRRAEDGTLNALSYSAAYTGLRVKSAKRTFFIEDADWWELREGKLFVRNTSGTISQFSLIDNGNSHLLPRIELREACRFHDVCVDFDSLVEGRNGDWLWVKIGLPLQLFDGFTFEDMSRNMAKIHFISSPDKPGIEVYFRSLWGDVWVRSRIDFPAVNSDIPFASSKMTFGRCKDASPIDADWLCRTHPQPGTLWNNDNGARVGTRSNDWDDSNSLWVIQESLDPLNELRSLPIN